MSHSHSHSHTHTHTHSLTLTLKQRHMLGNQEIDTLCMDDTGLTLAHSAAMTNNLPILILLVNEGGLPLQALQLPDENLVSPAMVAIQVCV